MDTVAEEFVEFDPFAGAEVERVMPTSQAQREVWLADQLSSQASLAFNESVSLRLRGRLDKKAIEGALNALMARHDSLRTTLGPDGTELLVNATTALALEHIDLSGDSPARRDALLRKAAAEAVQTPFDLERGPLLRAALYRIDGLDHVLMMTAHHIVCDGWSWGLITDDLGALYAEQIGAAPGPDPAPSYAEYVGWESAQAGTPEMAEHEAYWLGRYTGSSLPVLDLATDRPRPAVRTFNSERLDFLLDAGLMAELRKLGAKAGASFFATLFSGFAALLHRLTGADDIVIGVPSAGQSASGMTGLVGHCVNLLPVRTAVDGRMAFDQFVRQSGTSLLDAFDHQTLTYGSLLKKLPLRRDPSRMPLVSVMFNVDQAVSNRSSAFPDIDVEFSSNARQFENFELFINATPRRDGVCLECQYNTDLFDAATIETWMGAYQALLRSAVGQPVLPIQQLKLLNPAQRDALRALQPAPTALPADALMHSAFLRQRAAAPDRVALCSGESQLTYRALDERSNRLAQALRKRGIGRGERVGLCLSRGSEMVVALLAVLKAGATYVPLDPAFPQARLAYYAEDAHLALLISETAVSAAPTAWRADAAQRILRLDSDRSWLDASPEPLPPGPADATPASAAYIIYTSGSTGKPKGVCLPHSAVANFLASMVREPGITADDRLAAVTTLSFDIAVLELMLPLSVGAQVVIVPRETAMDGNLLCALLGNSGATMMQATPGMWRMLLDTAWDGGRGFKALVGGESLPPDLAHDLVERTGELWNMYGPTETTVWSTVWHVSRAAAAQRGMSIGRPIGNTSVWILDQNLQPCPLGVPGEICIGGDGVALGYLDRPELTADRFVADPFSNIEGARMYRTGDRGRWRNDGLLEHLGRLDFQVKVRGYRIELGEIEAGCNEIAGVTQSVVLAREDSAGDVRLVAYLTLADAAAFDEAALRTQLRARLPDYMLPQHVVILAGIPLLPNGKVDRKALPTPDVSTQPARIRIAPRNPLEARVAESMAAALRLPGLSVDDDFFALGGHSLLAAQLAMSLSASCGVKVPLRAVFESPTIKTLSRWIEAHPSMGGVTTLALDTAADQSRAPASLMQQRVWYLEQLDPGRLTYNTPSAHRLRGPLDAAALEQAFNHMIRRQAVLRTAVVNEGGVPVQRILPELKISLEVIDNFAALPVTERESALRAALEARVAELIPLEQAPLFRVGLYKLEADEHVLFFMPHHIIWDGWSFDLFYSEMAALYGAYSRGRQPDTAQLPRSYGDFARWQQEWLLGADLRQQLAHWKGVLADLPESLDLPTDLPRPPTMSGHGATVAISSSAESTEAVRRLGQSLDATLYMTLLAAYAALLSRLSGQSELVIGTPVRGRHSAEVENVMGFFVNALPLRLSVQPEMSFAALVKHTRQVVLDAFSFPDVPFEHLVRELELPRDESRTPLYQAFFSFQDARRRIRCWGDLQLEQVHLFQPGAAEDLGLWFFEHPEGLAGGLSYNTDVFTQAGAERFMERFRRLLASGVADAQVSIAQLPLVGEDEQRALQAWNLTAAKPAGVHSVHALIERQAAATPRAVALRSGDAKLTYAELDMRSNRLAHLLRSRRIGRGQRVGLCVERGIDMVVAQFAVLKSGAAYVPLDPAYPPERLAYMAADARLALVLTESVQAHALSWPREQSLWLDVDASAIGAHSASALTADPEFDAEPQDPAYVIYTSGSTGKPKGVLVAHRGVVNFLLSMAREPGLTAQDRLVAVTTLSFDIAVLELLLPLSVGASVELAGRAQVTDGAALRELITRSGANVMQATPATWRMLIDAGWDGSSNFKALIGGEGLPPDLAAQLLQRTGSLWNMYGPTETTVWSTCWKVEHPEHGISIGRPIANTSVWILDARQQTCGLGVPGEIYIGGDGVATGYLDRPELTAERFVADPHHPGARLYRTGDLGRWRTDGLLEHLGRLDFQVKVRGHRIELGEIEMTLASHAQIARALVIVREDQPGDARLVAYCVRGSGAALETQALREHIRACLPEYMVPQHFVELDSIPLLPNGKVNRQALPVPNPGANQNKAFAAPQTPTERAVADVWQRLLGVDEVGLSDNFFDLGGHSLLAMQAVSQLQQRFGRGMSARRFVFDSLGQLAAAYDEASAAPVGTGSAVAPRPAGGLFKRIASLIRTH